MSGREKLPQRRSGETLELECRGRRYIVTANRFPDGRLAELFIRSGKSGSDLDIATSEAAIVASFCLQHGVSLDLMRAAMPRDHQGKAEGPTGTLLDLLAGESGR